MFPEQHFRYGIQLDQRATFLDDDPLEPRAERRRCDDQKRQDLAGLILDESRLILELSEVAESRIDLLRGVRAKAVTHIVKQRRHSQVG